MGHRHVTDASGSRRYKGIPTHPAIHKLLRQQAVELDRSLTDHHHVLLCSVLGRPDLIPVPEHQSGARAVSG